MLFSKVIIITFAHKKKSINFILFYVNVCGVIINFVNLFRQMPVNTQRQMASLSPLIKFSKKTKKKKFQNRYQLRNMYPFQYQNLRRKFF
jgi:hypothetical protein